MDTKGIAMGHVSDEQLMLMFREGKVEGFDTLFAKYQVSVHRFILHVVQDAAKADDLLQDVFLDVAKAAPNYRPLAKFRTWLFRIARNRCLKTLESTRIRRGIEAELVQQSGGGKYAGEAADPDPTPDQRAEASETMELVQRGLSALAERQREALVLYAIEGLRYKEIAQIMDIPINTVKTLIHRARNALAVLMADDLPDEYRF